MFYKLITITMLSFAAIGSANAAISQTKGDFEDKFRQLDESLPTPNVYRNAAGEPGHPVLNDEEARMLTGETNLISAGRRLLTYGPSRAIIKKGEHGAVSLTEDSYFSAPAYPTEDVVDPTGAGDTFAGALMGYLAAHDSASEEVIRRGIVLGSVVASFTVEGFGLDRLREIDQAAIEQRYRELRSYCTVE